MDEEEQARAMARTAGIVLGVTGGVELAYALAYTVWSLVGTAWSGLGAGVSLLSAQDSGGWFVAGWGAWGFVVDLVQLVGTALLVIGAVVVMVGGLRLTQLRSRGLVVLACLTAIGLPLVSLLLSALSVFSLDLCGMFCGCAPSVVVALIGLVGGIYALATARNGVVVELWNLQ